MSLNVPSIQFCLQGRVALVTGGAQGIGEACVRRLHRQARALRGSALQERGR